MARDAKGRETREKLLDGALRALVEHGIAGASARTVAAAAGVNQALVFYHFGSVDDLLAAACRRGAEQRVARHRDRLRAVTRLTDLLAFGRAMHAEEREAGHVAVLAQLLAGTPLDGVTDPAGLARAVAASFVGLELYEGVDPDGADAALTALEQLGALLAAVEELNPMARKAVAHTLRRSGGRGR